MLLSRRLRMAPQGASHAQMYTANTSEILGGCVCCSNNAVEGPTSKGSAPPMQFVDAAAGPAAYWAASWGTHDPLGTIRQPTWIRSHQAVDLAGVVQQVRCAAYQGRPAVAI